MAADLAPLVPTPDTGRVQLALNVDDLGEAVTFSSKLFGTALRSSGPATRFSRSPARP